MKKTLFILIYSILLAGSIDASCIKSHYDENLSSGLSLDRIPRVSHSDILLSKTFLNSIIIKLRENLDVKLVENIIENRKSIKEETLSLIRGKNRKTQESFFETLTEILKKRYPADSSSIQKAAQESAGYLSVNDINFVEKVPTESINFRKRVTGAKEVKVNQEVLNAQAKEASWPGVEEYVVDRVGPLGGFLKDMGRGDQISLSNLDIEDFIVTNKIKKSDIKTINKLNLPISSYRKDIYVINLKSGKKIVSINNFETSGYIHHFEMMIRRVVKEQGISFRRFEKKSLYQKNRMKLSNFFAENIDDLKDVRNMAIGYDQAFAKNRDLKLLKTIVDEKNDWSANIYRLKNGEKLAVFSTDQATYGSLLAKQIDNALSKNKNSIKRFFFGGSGGILKNALPYEVINPGKIEISRGNYYHNILSNFDDSSSIHKTVASPLEETKEYIQNGLKLGVRTVDMEMGHLAKMAKKNGIELGVGVLATDSPSNFISYKMEDIGLTHQKFDRKIIPRDNYQKSVVSYIENGIRLEHPLEIRRGKALEEISKTNVQELRKKLSTLSNEEKKAIRRIQKTRMSYYVRMSPARLSYLLKDEVLLSTKKVQQIYKVGTTEYTPKIEDKLYGAYDDIFSSFGLWKGRKEYGNVILTLKPERVRNETWGSFHSGHHYIEKAKVGNKSESELISTAQDLLSKESFVGDDYKEALSLSFIDFSRRNNLDLSKALKLNNKEFRKWLQSHEHFFIEAHHSGYINFEQIENIEIPDEGIFPELKELIKEKGFNYTEYKE